MSVIETTEPSRATPRLEHSSADTVIAAFDTSASNGLTASEASERLATNGPNRLPEPESQPAWKLFVDQFHSPLVIILAVGAVLAAVVGDSLKDPIVIGVVLLLNAILGFVQESKAAKGLAALRQMLAPVARVRRDGEEIRIEADDLVVGDIVVLEAGDKVPADGRVLSVAALEVDESTMTGESLPVPKIIESLPSTVTTPGDRINSVFMNTTVTRGRGDIVVTGIGVDTEIGRLAELMSRGDSEPTPLQKQLHQLANRLGVLAGVAMVTYMTIELIRGTSFSDTLSQGVALAVASVPEGLPAVVTVTLALGVSRMTKRGAIVKRLASVETLGSTSVICSDKTGTLTLNKMTARGVVVGRDHYEVTGEGYGSEGVVSNDGIEVAQPEGLLLELAKASALCNDSRVIDGELLGDPTEGALVALASKLGVNRDGIHAAVPRVAEIPFDPAVKLMATFHHDDDLLGQTVVYVKGATDMLLPKCHITDDDAAFIHTAMDDIARTGQRVLAVARTTLVGDPPAGATVEELMNLVADLELLGIVGIVDPPRTEARDAISVAHRAGIDVKMITGDHVATAGAIAAELGITGAAVSGKALDAMSDDELTDQVESIGVFARVTPEHKLRIIDALRGRGHVVAMTGDGVNDAPALQKSDVGVAMGITGTEVAKEASDMVLTDDDFSTIVRAVEHGRSIYSNIITFVRFQLSTNIGAISLILGSSIAGLGKPLTALQILWVNLIMDGPPAMTMGIDPPGQGIMNQKPRPQGVGILSRNRFSWIALMGVTMAIGTGLVINWATDHPEKGAELALTMGFTTFVLFQVFNAFNARAEGRSVFHRDSLTNHWFWISIGTVAALQVVVVQWSALHSLFSTTSMTIGQWGICIAVASSVMVVDELRKLGLRLAGRS